MSVDAYMTARSEFSATKQQLKAVTDTVSLVASRLQSDPRKFIFSNQNIGLPPEASMSRDSASVDAGSWPNVEQIMRLLERYHQQYSALQSAWGALSPDQQSSMKDPTDLLGESGYGRRGY